MLEQTRKQTDEQTNEQTNKQTDKNRLTVDDDYLHHGNGEEGQRFQRNFDEDGSDNED